jgi:hypothetical protein
MLSALALSACDFDIRGAIDGDDTLLGLQMALPDGAVVAFDSAICPAGWSDDSLLNGRVIVGKGSGNNDIEGNALTARSLGATGGLEYTTGLPAYSGSGNTSTPEPNSVPALGTFAYLSGSMGIDTMGTEADSNFAPFIVRHYCRKNNSTATLAASAVVMFDLASCGSHFALDAASAGRMMVGSGAGNHDSLGAPLTPRALSDTGGYEQTVMGGFPVNDSPADEVSPEPGFYFSDTGPASYDLGFDSTFGGVYADGNMPPYVVLTACKASTEMDTVQSGAVVAFELAACPSGWSNYAAGAGRILIGSGTGAGLSARVLDVTGGHEYTTGVPVLADTGITNTPVGCFLASLGANGYSTLAPDTTIGGVKADSNMPPFEVLLYCKKN